MTDRVAAGYPPTQQQTGDPVPTQNVRIPNPQADSANMNSREHSQIPPAPTYPSPNASQINQGTMAYYPNQQRQLTDDELHLSAELSREVGAPNVAEGSSNGMPPHGQTMGIPPSQPAAATDANRGPAEHHQQHPVPQQHAQHPPQAQPQQQPMMQFPQGQQVGVDPNHDLSYGEQSARRKRSKVSRACDECRRKKVRCDATSEGVETCSNCRRTNSQCEFSRVPMKRGPSKGYIKELADRINSLESQIQPGMPQQDMPYQPMQDDSSPRGYQEFSPAVDNQLVTRKRTFSMSEGLPNNFLHPAYNQMPRPSSVGAFQVGQAREAPHIGAEGFGGIDGMYAGANGVKTSQPFWSQDANAEQSKMEPIFDAISIDDRVLDAYYHHIHTILPILPNSRERLVHHLQRCERHVQEILLHALVAVTGASPLRVEKEFQHIPAFDKAQDHLYMSFREDPAARPMSVNLVLLQSTMLMMVEADGRGPENLRGQDGIPKSVLVEAAYALAYYVAKSLGQLVDCNPDDKDVDSNGNLARRNWIVLMILSRIHTVGVAGNDYFGFYEAATINDRQIASFATLQLSRYSTFLSQVVGLAGEIASLPNHIHPAQVRGLKRCMVANLNGVRDIEALRLENVHESSTLALNEIYSPLMFWFITLFIKRQIFTYDPAEVLYPAEVVIELLHKQSENSAPICSPFHFHFLALAVVTLLEITDIPELAHNAWVSIDKALQIITQREKHAATAGEFEKIFASQRWEASIHAFIEAKLSKVRGGQFGTQTAANVVGPTEQRSLQHLADLAVGAGGNANANTSTPPPGSAGNAAAGEDKEGRADANKQPGDQRVFVDFSLLTNKGYLNVLAGN